jgi:hypothetical protein
MRNRIALFALLAGACGKVDDLPVDAAAPDATREDAATSGDASIFADALFLDVVAVDAIPPTPDAGPGPSPPCADAANPCELPPSYCLDDHWLRSYTNGRCTDAGVCAFDVYDMQCFPAPVPPDCYQGGCRVVIVR